MNARTLMSLSEDDGATYRPYINTGTPLDITNGKFVPTTTGTWAMSGGLGMTTAFIADANKFKSTCLHGTAVNAMARFPESEYYDFDSEYAALDTNRLANMSNLYVDEPEKREAHITDLEKRIKIFDPTTDHGENLDAWFDFMKQLRDTKIKQFKDWEVETEILDPTTGKPYRMMLPTFVGIDSWTEALVRQLNIKNEEHNAGTEMSAMRTIFMEEGWNKARLMRQLPSICAKAGIYCIMTGHLGRKQSMDGKPVKKDMQYMNQDETTKAMGPKFNFLMSSIFKISSTKALVGAADRTITDYPSDTHVSGTELQELSMMLVRCKNAPSGSQTQMVSSQRFGIMTGLSYYNYLRNNKYYGIGNPRSVRSPLLDNLDIGRTKIFDLSRTYKVERALELTYQLFVIQNNWSLMGQPVDYSIGIDAFAEQLQKSGYAVDDILSSRGWWSYKGAAGLDRPFMTLPDILAILNGTYKPKFWSVSTTKK
jgi:hypothetical protein